MNIYNNVLRNNELSTTDKLVLLSLANIANEDLASISLVELSSMINITKPTLIKSLNLLEDKGLINKYNSKKRYSKNIYKLNIN